MGSATPGAKHPVSPPASGVLCPLFFTALGGKIPAARIVRGR